MDATTVTEHVQSLPTSSKYTYCGSVVAHDSRTVGKEASNDSKKIFTVVFLFALALPSSVQAFKGMRMSIKDDRTTNSLPVQVTFPPLPTDRKTHACCARVGPVQDAMGMLIGKGGAGLRDMQEKSRVKVGYHFLN